MGSERSVQVYRRADGRWAWRRLHGSDVVATDGSQGYENFEACLSLAQEVNVGVTVYVLGPEEEPS